MLMYDELQCTCIWQANEIMNLNIIMDKIECIVYLLHSTTILQVRLSKWDCHIY